MDSGLEFHLAHGCPLSEMSGVTETVSHDPEELGPKLVLLLCDLGPSPPGLSELQMSILQNEAPKNNSKFSSKSNSKSFTRTLY